MGAFFCKLLNGRFCNSKIYPMEKLAIRIFGILIRNKKREGGCVQEILARYSPSIKTRLGIHDVEHTQSYPHGLIIIQIIGSDDLIERFEKELYMIEGIEVQHMFFEL